MTAMRLQPASLVYSMADSGIQTDSGKMVHQLRITHTSGIHIRRSRRFPDFHHLDLRCMQQLTIAWQDLSDDALQGVIEDYVTREGTDYGDQPVSLARKVAQVRAQLQSGQVVIVFDGESATCSIVSLEQLRAAQDLQNTLGTE